MRNTLKKILKNTYIQTLLALIITIAIVISLGNLLYQPVQNSFLQLGSLIGIGITLFLFFAFSLWKVNQQKQWISVWANHPFWVLLTFAIFPAFISISFNLPVINDAVADEILITIGSYSFPHFMFFYFWEALVFGIAFLAHPDRNKINWHFSLKQLLFGLLLSLGLWSSIMFINEIQLQWTAISFNYLESKNIFWPVIPIAVILIPISTSYFFFYNKNEKPVYFRILLLIFFTLLPLRMICLLPAAVTGVVLLLINKKEISFTTTVVTYALLNLFTLLLNWHWVI